MTEVAEHQHLNQEQVRSSVIRALEHQVKRGEWQERAIIMCEDCRKLIQDAVRPLIEEQTPESAKAIELIKEFTERVKRKASPEAIEQYEASDAFESELVRLSSTGWILVANVSKWDDDSREDYERGKIYVQNADEKNKLLTLKELVKRHEVARLSMAECATDIDKLLTELGFEDEYQFLDSFDQKTKPNMRERKLKKLIGIREKEQGVYFYLSAIFGLVNVVGDEGHRSQYADIAASLRETYNIEEQK